MILDNLSINRVVIHEVFEREDDRTIVTPRYGTGLVALDSEAMEALSDRVILAMGRSSQSVAMAIDAATPGSMVHLASTLLPLPDAQFVTESKRIADGLAAAQKHRKIPGGVVVVTQGTVSHPAKPWIGVIKAETQNGFTRVQASRGINLQFLKDLILTPQTKLYKIGIFIQEASPTGQNDDLTKCYSAHIYDHGMSANNRDGAAQYFYEGFLGCRFPPTAARLTRHFYEYTKNFIHEMDTDQETKAGLNTALVTYLKVNQKPIISATEFADIYLPPAAAKDAYINHLRRKSFPDRGISKDISEVASKLRFRNLRFRSQIKLTAPADAFEALVKISEIPADGGDAPNWTQIIIKDAIATQG